MKLTLGVAFIIGDFVLLYHCQSARQINPPTSLETHLFSLSHTYSCIYL